MALGADGVLLRTGLANVVKGNVHGLLTADTAAVDGLANRDEGGVLAVVEFPSDDHLAATAAEGGGLSDGFGAELLFRLVAVGVETGSVLVLLAGALESVGRGVVVLLSGHFSFSSKLVE